MIYTQGVITGDLNIPFTCARCNNTNHHYQTIRIRFCEKSDSLQLIELTCEVCKYHKEASINLQFEITKD